MKPPEYFATIKAGTRCIEYKQLETKPQVMLKVTKKAMKKHKGGMKKNE